MPASGDFISYPCICSQCGYNLHNTKSSLINYNSDDSRKLTMGILYSTVIRTAEVARENPDMSNELLWSMIICACLDKVTL